VAESPSHPAHPRMHFNADNLEIFLGSFARSVHTASPGVAEAICSSAGLPSEVVSPLPNFVSQLQV